MTRLVGRLAGSFPTCYLRLVLETRTVAPASSIGFGAADMVPRSNLEHVFVLPLAGSQGSRVARQPNRASLIRSSVGKETPETYVCTHRRPELGLPRSKRDAENRHRNPSSKRGRPRARAFPRNSKRPTQPQATRHCCNAEAKPQLEFSRVGVDSSSSTLSSSASLYTPSGASEVCRSKPALAVRQSSVGSGRGEVKERAFLSLRTATRVVATRRGRS